MRKVKGLVLFVLVCLLVCGFAAPVLAVESVAATVAFGGFNNNIGLQGVYLSSNYGAYAQSFTVMQTGYLSNISIMMSKTGSPDANIRMMLFGNMSSLSGTLNTTICEVSSTTYFANGLSGTKVLCTFAFSAQYELFEDDIYTFVVYVPTANLLNQQNDVSISSVLNGGYTGCLKTWTGAVWSAWDTTSIDLCFIVNVNSVYGGGVSPTTTPVINLPTDLFSSDLMWYIVALVLVLTPTFLLGVFMRGGKWGFLIGLAIGAGLAYIVVPSVMPIWMVILVAIGLGAAFLSSVRSGG